MSNVARLIRNYPTPANGVALFWLGNSGFAFKAGNGQVIYIDPLLSDAVYEVNGWQRLQPPPFHPAEADCDLLLITHGHADHLDPDSVPGIARATRAPIAAPPSCVGRMLQMGLPAEQLRPLRPGDRIEHGDIAITAVRAHHMHPQNPQPDAVGLVLSYGDIRVYHAGDTAYTAEVRDSVTPLGPLRAALLPISGKRCILTAEDAAFYAGDLNADIVVPIHYGMFAENNGDPTELLHYMRRYEVKSRLIPLPFLGGLILEPSQAQLAGLECGCH